MFPEIYSVQQGLTYFLPDTSHTGLFIQNINELINKSRLTHQQMFSENM